VNEKSVARPQPAPLGFTLIESLVIISIIALLLVFVIPAFTTLKSADEVSNAAHSVKGVLDQARTYAQSNNTYAWVGFFEEDGSIAPANPAVAGHGRLVLSIVASKDGSTVYDPATPNPIDPTKLAQIGKLVRIDNVHLPIFAAGSGTGDTFDSRPLPDWNAFNGYNDSQFGELNAGPLSAPHTDSRFPFQYPVGNPAPAAQYTFRKTLQFSPRGESRINSTYDLRRVVEIGLVPTKSNVTPSPFPSPGLYPGNSVAVQISGFASNVKIYRR
jgi:type II secretory pathway pseudopilin PulG